MHQSSYPPGAASEHQHGRLGLRIGASHEAPQGFRHKGPTGKAHHFMGRTEIHPGKPQTHHPAQVHHRVHSLFGKKVT